MVKSDDFSGINFLRKNIKLQFVSSFLDLERKAENVFNFCTNIFYIMNIMSFIFDQGSFSTLIEICVILFPMRAHSHF